MATDCALISCKGARQLEDLLGQLFFELSARVFQAYFEARERDLREAREELEVLTRIYALLREINLLIFEERSDPRKLFQEACGIMIRTGGFALAWVGLAGEVVAAAGETAVLEGVPPLKKLQREKILIL